MHSARVSIRAPTKWARLSVARTATSAMIADATLRKDLPQQHQTQLHSPARQPWRWGRWPNLGAETSQQHCWGLGAFDPCSGTRLCTPNALSAFLRPQPLTRSKPKSFQARFAQLAEGPLNACRVCYYSWRKGSAPSHARPRLLCTRSTMPSTNARWFRVDESMLVLSMGDLTTWSGDALVNAGGAPGKGDRVICLSCPRSFSAGCL